MTYFMNDREDEAKQTYRQAKSLFRWYVSVLADTAEKLTLYQKRELIEGCKHAMEAMYIMECREPWHEALREIRYAELVRRRTQDML